MAVFMDRLNVHRCRQVLQAMQNLRLKHVLNASYSPDYNPIEGVFSVAKNRIKRTRLEAIVNGRRLQLEAVIKDAFKNVGKDVCVNLI